jgi:uncharacterized protein YjbI with pentapeptide repeats
MGANLNPFDVEALEKSVNDSAVRVSTIWISFLVFGLYLAIAAGGTTPRQLFLEEPIKLPVLDINLPLVAFYFLAPLLFVIFHLYVLVQVLLLARTAGAYNEAVEHTMPVAADRARIRQRLANTLFAQIFAGAPRERIGLLGGLLRLMAWATLAIAPVAVLLIIEVKFLPYHGWFVTWTHRVLIACDLAVVLLLWAAALNPERDVAWRSVLNHRLALLTALGLWLASVGIVSFPGEPHADWTRFADRTRSAEAYTPSKCELNLLPYSDRIELWGETLVVAYKKLTRRQRGEIVEGFRYLPDKTRDLQSRDLSCGAFSRTDLRGADFSFANLIGANLFLAELEGATFAHAKLETASFQAANLRETSFFGAHLQGAELDSAQLQGASLSLADLRGASLKLTELQGANLSGADLRGADLQLAQLRGADLKRAKLQGANLSRADLQGADLHDAQLLGANLTQAQLQAANLNKAELQGARFGGSALTLAAMTRAHVWGTTGAQCEDARVIEPQLDSLSSTVAGIDGFIEQAVQDIPEKTKQQMKTSLHAQLTAEARDDANEQVWRACEAKALTREEWEKRHALYLVDLACNAGRQENQKYVANGFMYIYGLWLPDALNYKSRHAHALARGLLGLDDTPCPGGKELDEEALVQLREVVRRNSKNR